MGKKRKRDESDLEIRSEVDKCKDYIDKIVSPIHLAARNGDLDAFKELSIEDIIKAEKDFDNGNGYLPSHLAVLDGHQNIVEYLVGMGFNLNQLSRTGYTHLHLASMLGHLEIVKILLEVEGIEGDRISEDGYSAFHLAAKFGHLEIVEFFVDEVGFYFHLMSEDGYSAFHLAAMFGHLEIVKFLVDVVGINCKSISEDGYSAFHLAARYSKNPDLLTYLEDSHLPIQNSDYEEIRGLKSIPTILDLAIVSLVEQINERNKLSKKVDNNAKSFKEAIIYLADCGAQLSNQEIDCNTLVEALYNLNMKSSKIIIKKFMKSLPRNYAEELKEFLPKDYITQLSEDDNEADEMEIDTNCEDKPEAYEAEMNAETSGNNLSNAPENNEETTQTIIATESNQDIDLHHEDSIGLKYFKDFIILPTEIKENFVYINEIIKRISTETKDLNSLKTLIFEILTNPKELLDSTTTLPEDNPHSKDSLVEHNFKNSFNIFEYIPEIAKVDLTQIILNNPVALEGSGALSFNNCGSLLLNMFSSNLLAGESHGEGEVLTISS